MHLLPLNQFLAQITMELRHSKEYKTCAQHRIYLDHVLVTRCMNSQVLLLMILTPSTSGMRTQGSRRGYLTSTRSKATNLFTMHWDARIALTLCTLVSFIHWIQTNICDSLKLEAKQGLCQYCKPAKVSLMLTDQLLNIPLYYWPHVEDTCTSAFQFL